jgi:YggT family protein
MYFVASIIHRIFQLLILIVIIQAVLSFFVDPFHPVRRALDRIVDPFLAPIRRFLPPMAGLDFSPIILIIVLQVLDMILRSLFTSFA